LLDAEAISDIDTSATDSFREMLEELKERGITVGIAGANRVVLDMMQKTGLEEMIGKENFFPTIRTGIISFGEKFLGEE